MDTWKNEWGDRLLGLSRIVIGFLFLTHGMQKFFAIPPPVQPMPQMAQYSILWFSGVIELACGILVLLGLLTRLFALIAAGEMAVAYFMMHAPNGFWPILNGGELAVAYCFIFLAFVATGSGAWSLDRLFSRHGERPAPTAPVTQSPVAPQT